MKRTTSSILSSSYSIALPFTDYLNGLLIWSKKIIGNRMAEEAIVNSVRRYLNYLKDNGITVSFGVLFGSQVTGTANEGTIIKLN